ncbi:MAG: SPOR domain-containing protein [Rhizobiaceae bacterium]|nr:SPOR domain-containing protein [Rhizobiaceae bacterium]
MADTTQNRMASQASTVDDDPFAELTRIMGFDPRQPVSRPAAQPAAAPVQQPPAETEFDIDLERELMGEYSDAGAYAGSDQYDAAPEVDVFQASQPAGPSALRAEPDFDLAQEAYGSAPSSEVYAAEEPDVDPAPVLAARPADRFEADVDLPHLPLAGRADATGVAPPPSFDAAHDDVLEQTLESELDVLIGSELPARQASDAARHAAPDADNGFAGRFDAMEPGSGFDAADDLDADAVDRRDGSDEGAAPLAEVARRWSLHTGPRPAVHPGEQPQFVVSAAAHEGSGETFDPAFDDHAFDTAISNGLNGEDALRPDWAAAAPADVTDDKVDAVMPRDGHDPYAALAALSADLQGAAAWQGSVVRPADAAAGGSRPAAYGAPDIETIDVPEQAVALADDLDLPELAFDDDPAPASSYDDIDAEFASLLNEMNSIDADAPAVSRQTEQPAARPDYDLDRAAMAAAGIALAAGAPSSDGRRYAPDDYYSDAAPGQPAAGEMADMEFAYDPDAEEDIPPAYQASAPKPSRGKGLMVAALVAGVAALGGVGALALSFGNGTSGEVALVRADPSPTKVRPENPGGATIPNQDNKVYDSVAGADAAAEPTQRTLVQSAETPVDLPSGEDDVETADAGMQPEDGLAPGVTMDEAGTAKGEDRVEQAVAEPGVDSSVEVAAVPPRKVRTMIVKADGTLVAREEPATTAATVDTASESMVDPAGPTQLAAADPVDVTGTNPSPAVATAPSKQPARKTSVTPVAAPIAPSRPSDQPVDIVGEVQPQQVAALAPAATGGSWAMQIASQPSEAAAQASYKDLSRRYSGVLGGKQASIVKADIAGKGTYWRVRVAAASRADAVKMCESYKAAGGSCFVSK